MPSASALLARTGVHWIKFVVAWRMLARDCVRLRGITLNLSLYLYVTLWPRPAPLMSPRRNSLTPSGARAGLRAGPFRNCERRRIRPTIRPRSPKRIISRAFTSSSEAKLKGAHGTHGTRRAPQGGCIPKLWGFSPSPPSDGGEGRGEGEGLGDCVPINNFGMHLPGGTDPFPFVCSGCSVGNPPPPRKRPAGVFTRAGRISQSLRNYFKVASWNSFQSSRLFRFTASFGALASSGRPLAPRMDLRVPSSWL